MRVKGLTGYLREYRSTEVYKTRETEPMGNRVNEKTG